MNYEHKYLKYKSKYLSLKNNLEGGLLGISSTLYKLRFLKDEDFAILKSKLDTIGKDLYQYEEVLKTKSLKDINFVNLYKVILGYEKDALQPIKDFEKDPPRNDIERNVLRELKSQRDYFKWLHLWFKVWVYDLYQKRFGGPARSIPNPSEIPPQIFINGPLIEPSTVGQLTSVQPNIRGNKFGYANDLAYHTGNPYGK